MRANNSLPSRVKSFFTACLLIFTMTHAATLTGMSRTTAKPSAAAGEIATPIPFPGPAPKSLPAVIEMENFDRGGEGVGYHELSGTAGSGLYRNRPVEGVDIQAFSGASGGFVVTEASAGEWLSYTISNETAGSYELNLRYTSEFREGTFHIEIDGRNATGAMTAMSTGPAFRSIFRKVDLAAGQHTLRLVMDGNSAGSASVCEFDSIAFRALKTQPGTARNENSGSPSLPAMAFSIAQPSAPVFQARIF